MSKKLATLIKEARTNAGYTQKELADKIPGLSATDLSKAERNEMDLTQEQLKNIAKVTGVTQKSLLDAAGSKKTAGKSSSATASSSSTMKLSAAEKKLVELYREADTEKKKAALKALKGESSEANELIASLLGSAMESFLKEKK